MPLTDTRLRALKPKDKPYKVTDERGLYVEVTPTGSKLWRFRYRIGGAQKKLFYIAVSDESDILDFVCRELKARLWRRPVRARVMQSLWERMSWTPGV